MAGEELADISYYQAFNAAQYNLPAIFIRASFGVSLRDPKFASYWAAAKARGIKRAAYHFLVANVSADEQFAFFKSIMDSVGGVGVDENLMIDDESYAATGGLPSRANVQRFAQLCQAYAGIWPIHYSLTSVGRVLTCAQTDAVYGNTNPGSDFWQHTDGAVGAQPRSAAGIGACDMNRCNGTLASYFLGGAQQAAPAYQEGDDTVKQVFRWDEARKWQHMALLAPIPGTGHAVLYYKQYDANKGTFFGPIALTGQGLDDNAGLSMDLTDTEVHILCRAYDTSVATGRHYWADFSNIGKWYSQNV